VTCHMTVDSNLSEHVHFVLFDVMYSNFEHYSIMGHCGPSSASLHYTVQGSFPAGTPCPILFLPRARRAGPHSFELIAAVLVYTYLFIIDA